VVWDRRLIGDPGGPASITGTARFMTTTFYIATNLLSGHTAESAIWAASGTDVQPSCSHSVARTGGRGTGTAVVRGGAGATSPAQLAEAGGRSLR
jgi:hypothetical protein